jgi:hypothetical protein
MFATVDLMFCVFATTSLTMSPAKLVFATVTLFFCSGEISDEIGFATVAQVFCYISGDVSDEISGAICVFLLFHD